MKLYHGTASYNKEGILKEGLKRYPHQVGVVACCSTSLEEAGFFALRKTPLSDLSQTGVVIEFEAGLNGKDFVAVESRGLLRDEREIAVLNTKRLIPRAVWEWSNRGWIRQAI